MHAIRTLEHPRWEDYNYEQADGVGNPLYWLGDGQTLNEKTLTGDSEYRLSDLVLFLVLMVAVRGVVSERGVYRSST